MYILMQPDLVITKLHLYKNNFAVSVNFLRVNIHKETVYIWSIIFISLLYMCSLYLCSKCHRKSLITTNYLGQMLQFVD